MLKLRHCIICAWMMHYFYWVYARFKTNLDSNRGCKINIKCKVQFTLYIVLFILLLYWDTPIQTKISWLILNIHMKKNKESFGSHEIWKFNDNSLNPNGSSNKDASQDIPTLWRKFHTNEACFSYRRWQTVPFAKGRVIQLRINSISQYFYILSLIKIRIISIAEMRNLNAIKNLP